jgi:hypothetical protein
MKMNCQKSVYTYTTGAKPYNEVATKIFEMKQDAANE